MGRKSFVVVLLCMYRLAVADEADRLYQAAKQELDQKCQPRACDFAGAAAKLKRAYLLRADAKFANTYCDYARKAKLTPALEADTLLMCEVADLGDDDFVDSLRENRAKKGRSSSAAAAARALYGVGLTLGQSDGPKPTMTLSWGTITPAAMQELIRDHYVGVIQTTDDLTFIPRKLEMCKRIAATIAQPAERKEVTEFCEWQAAIAMNAPQATFGGATGIERVKLADRARVFELDKQLRYQPVFALAAPKQLNNPKTLDAEREYLDKIIKQGAQHSHYKDAVARRSEIETYIKRRKQEAEKITKQLKAKPSQVAFMPYAPFEWDVPAPVSGHVETCAKLAAVAPAVGKENGDTELLVKVDGKECFNGYSLIAAPSIECAELVADGKHRIDAELFRVTWKKTGEKQITIHSKDSIDIRDKEAGSRGKRVARGSITCGAAQ